MKRSIAAIVVALVCTVVGVQVASSPATTGSHDTTTQVDPSGPALDVPADPGGLAGTEHAALTVTEARHAMAALPLAERHRGGYDRALFGDGWTITNGCTARQHVLEAEAVAGTVNPGTCTVVGGVWIDWYSADTPTITDPSKLDIDHLVPLSHAWQAGAWAWTPQQRQAFANDLTNPPSLTAVSAGQNRAKSDAPPDAWQPPNIAARCTYAKDWIATKTAWALTVTPAETDALATMLDRCSQ